MRGILSPGGVSFSVAAVERSPETRGAIWKATTIVLVCAMRSCACDADSREAWAWALAWALLRLRLLPKFWLEDTAVQSAPHLED